jgi:hypothetical protein
VLGYPDTAFDGGDEGVLESVEAVPLGHRRRWFWFGCCPAAQHGDVLGHASQELLDRALIDYRGDPS